MAAPFCEVLGGATTGLMVSDISIRYSETRTIVKKQRPKTFKVALANMVGNDLMSQRRAHIFFVQFGLDFDDVDIALLLGLGCVHARKCPIQLRQMSLLNLGNELGG